MRFALKPNYKNFVSNRAFRLDRDFDRFFSDFLSVVPREYEANAYRMAVDAEKITAESKDGVLL
ncbi:MAG: hypothetical protein ACK5RO_06945 [Pseudobdellovibrionaceae bacterium]|jgi:hypothetical protein